MFNSLRGRLIASYVIIILVCLLVLSLAIFVFVGQSLQEKLILPRLESSVRELRPHILALLERGGTPESIARRRQNQDSVSAGHILFVDNRGKIVADSAGKWSGQQVDLSMERTAQDSGLFVSGSLSMPGDSDYLYAATSLNPKAGNNLFLAVITPARSWYQVLSQPALRGGRNELFQISFKVGLLAFVVSVLLALIIARSIIRPLQLVASAAKKVAQGNYDLRLNISSPDEVRSLASSFNTMTLAVKNSRQAQRDFVANVSHELKTPLTSIQGFSQAIIDGTASDTESVNQAAGVIYDEANRMARMVSQLLDLAKIEAGQIVMAREPVDLKAVLASCVEKLSPQAAQEKVSLSLDLAQVPQEVTITGDADRLAQVFIILLDNALKHTPSDGRVTVAISGLDDSGVKVSVSDTGPGIPAEDISRIFERFYQVDKSRVRKKSGAGLGLAIAREIVLALGGEITAESIVGIGSKFTVQLPVKQSSTSATNS